MTDLNLNFEQGKPIAKTSKRVIHLDGQKGVKKEKITGTECPYCFKTFSRNGNLKRHLNDTCPFLKFDLIDEVTKTQHITTKKLLQILPQTYRECFYIAGPNGSGKSYFIRQYLRTTGDGVPVMILETLFRAS